MAQEFWIRHEMKTEITRDSVSSSWRRIKRHVDVVITIASLKDSDELVFTIVKLRRTRSGKDELAVSRRTFGALLHFAWLRGTT
jgi:hypothetical protein